LFNNRIYDILAAQMRRQIDAINVSSSNIANVDTPGYKAKKIVDSDSSFGNILALKITSPMQIQPVANNQYQIVQSDDIARNDGNNVNIEKEMVNIAKARASYEQLSSMLKFKLRSIDNLLNQLGKV